MIYITGDTHGTIDIRKLLDNQITEKMTKDDYVIICGDFGLVWNHKKENGLIGSMADLGQPCSAMATTNASHA